jgi:hypothetical protein
VKRVDGGRGCRLYVVRGSWKIEEVEKVEKKG